MPTISTNLCGLNGEDLGTITHGSPDELRRALEAKVREFTGNANAQIAVALQVTPRNVVMLSLHQPHNCWIGRPGQEVGRACNMVTAYSRMRSGYKISVAWM